MRKRAIVLVTAVAAGAAWVAGPTAPAAAAVTVTSSGTTISASITGSGSGNGTIGVSCVSGQARVLDFPATPNVTCAALTAVTFTTDNSSNSFGPPYPFASFPALVQSTINAGSGYDRIELSTTRDIVNAGGGGDTLTIPWGGADDTISMGGQTDDRVEVFGTAGDDVATVTSPGSNQTRLTSGTWDLTITQPRILDLALGAGNDTIGAASLPTTSGMTLLVVDGEAGNDLIVCGAVRCTISGGDGTNTLTGGAASDAISSTSRSDTLRGNGSVDGISDLGSRAFGGRTVNTTGTGANEDSYLARSAATPTCGPGPTAAPAPACGSGWPAPVVRTSTPASTPSTGSPTKPPAPPTESSSTSPR